jgi:TolB-like protein/Flp pilus assembly protein TadD
MTHGGGVSRPYAREVTRFGQFELDVGGYELRRQGRPVRLERRPMDVLILLVSRPGELVSRDEIVECLWGNDASIDVDTGLNTVIRKVRHALRDSPRTPTFIETVSGRGYRFVADVQRISTPGAGSSVMLAVLPFVNQTGDPEREYLADGFTEDVIASISQLEPDVLSVIGRMSAMAYKRTGKSLSTIGSELKVGLIVEGSIRSSQSLLQIRCTLNRARDQTQLWSRSYEADITALGRVQLELTLAIADQVRLRLSPERLERSTRRHSRDTAAYDLYLRGRRFWNQLTPATTRLAVDCFTRATEIDPHYALAWAGLAEAYAGAPINGDAEPLAMLPQAREAAERAIYANAQLSEAQHVSGQVRWFYDWDFSAADAAFRRAVQLDPSNAWAHSMFGHALSQLGRHDDARAAMERARTLEPFSPLHHAMSSQVAFQSRDMASAEDHARRAIAIDPEFWVGHMMRGQSCEQASEADLALDALTTAVRLSGGNSKPVALRGYVLARQGQFEAARDVLAVLQETSAQRYVPPYAMALVCAGLEQHEMVFDWLERALVARDVHLIFLPVDPKWDRYRSDSRFVSLLQRCGFADMR